MLVISFVSKCNRSKTRWQHHFMIVFKDDEIKLLIYYAHQNYVWALQRATIIFHITLCEWILFKGPYALYIYVFCLELLSDHHWSFFTIVFVEERSYWIAMWFIIFIQPLHIVLCWNFKRINKIYHTEWHDIDASYLPRHPKQIDWYIFRGDLLIANATLRHLNV